MHFHSQSKEQKDWYDQHAGNYDDFWVNPVSARVVDKWNLRNLTNILKAKEVKRVLDLGCGTGKTTVELEKISRMVVGYDISASMLQIARDRCHDNYFIKGDSAILPFQTGIFDLVVTNGVWHHFADIETTINEVSRVLRKGGMFAVLGENNALYKRDNQVFRFWQYLRLPVRVYNRILPISKVKSINSPGRREIPNEPEGTEDINPLTFTTKCETVMLRKLRLYTYDHIPRIENSRYIYRVILEIEKIVGGIIAPYDGQIIQGFWVKE